MQKPKSVVEHLAVVSSELMERRQNTKSYEILIKLESETPLRFGKKLWEDWDNLERCLPRTAFLTLHKLWENHTLDQRTTLARLIADITHSFPNLFEQSLTTLNVPPALSSIEILQDRNNRYWFNMYLYLNSWKSLTGVKLKAIEWIADTNTINMITHWEGEFSSIEKLKLEEVRSDFWTVYFRANQTACFSVASTILLLSVQLLAQKGGNLLSLVDLDDLRLTLNLEILKAGMFSSYSSSTFLLEDNLDQVVNYMLTMVFSNYITASKQLEISLSEEIRQLEPYLLTGDIKETWLNDLREILRELAITRKEVMALQ
jgi:hypothetical protein